MARRGLIAGAAAGLAILALAGGYLGNKAEARHRLEERVKAMTGGDPERGQAAIAKRPCGGCHQIPGIRGAKGKVGPPLAGFAGRAYIGGRPANTPENLVRWIRDPHAFDPETAMPPMGIGEPEARDIAAYLYTLG
jgi:cytochrome c2